MAISADQARAQAAAPGASKAAAAKAAAAKKATTKKPTVKTSTPNATEVKKLNEQIAAIKAQIAKSETSIATSEKNTAAEKIATEKFAAEQTIANTELELLGKQAGVQGKATAESVGAKLNTTTGKYELPKADTKYTAADGTVFTDLDAYERYQGMIDETTDIASTKKRAGESAYALLYAEFAKYGLGSLVESLQGYIQEGLSSAEFTLRLRETPAYKKRFAANAQRVNKGLSALSEAEYIGLEDQYQNIMRNYGLPASYYARGEMGRQEGFEKFLANDVSATELEDRITTAQSRVINANPEVTNALKQFYPNITNGDILAYTLDPTQGLESIKRKVTAAEIGGAAMQAGLSTNVSRAEQLGKYGVDKTAAEKGFGTIAGGLERGSQLASIYGEDPYTQTTAEEEIFNLQGAQGARKQRQKVTGLEQAAFAGKTGVTSGALARDRAGAY
jgi:hypothetical protein